MAGARLQTKPAATALRDDALAGHVEWPVKLFIASLLFPTITSINVGSLRLSPYRIVLIVLLPMLLARLLSGRAGRISLPDWFIVLNCVWASMALVVHHQGEGIEPAGIYCIELLASYCLARVFVRTPHQLRGAISFLLMILVLMLPFVLVESVTGNHSLQSAFSAIKGQSFSSLIDTRFGLHRAYGPFDHPILWGVFAASGIGMMWYRYSGGRLSSVKAWVVVLIPVLAAGSSLSSGAIATMTVQFILIAWEQLTRRTAWRWTIFLVGWTALYILIGALSNRSAMTVALSYLTFSAETAYGRQLIWEWGFYHNALPHPVFGIGQNDWIRLPWMFSSSMDNFWLMQMVTFGLPAFGFLAGAVLLSLLHRPKGMSPATQDLRTGWVFSMIGLIVAACTVHFWNHSFVWLAFLVGLAPCFDTPKSAPVVRAVSVSRGWR